MLIYVKREAPIGNATPGKLYIDGEYLCNTLEDLVRADGAKVYGQTAIPAGEYLIWLKHSPNFNRVLPTLMQVPMFSNVLIHRGNRAEQTDGCILIGFQRGLDKDGKYVIWESEKAENYLMRELTEASRRSVLAITVENENPI